MFVDVKTQQICYFDSGGDDIPVEISRLKDRIIQQGKQCHIDFKFRKNHPFEHQRYDSECGIYCLYFIESMIKNANFLPFKTSESLIRKWNAIELFTLEYNTVNLFFAL